MAGQQAITQHFNILDKITLLTKENEKLSEILRNVFTCSTSDSTKSPELTPILQNLLINIQNNTCLLSKQRHHLDVIKKFACIFTLVPWHMNFSITICHRHYPH